MGQRYIVKTLVHHLPNSRMNESKGDVWQTISVPKAWRIRLREQ
jgi:hypothetical protein